MLSENIRNLRRAHGMSQEDLASRLHVVRQTISKWEKGISVPDADLLQKLAEILETDAASLLGAPAPSPQSENETSQLARELANINAQLAEKNRRSRRIWRTIAGVFIGAAVLCLLLIVLSITAFRFYTYDDALSIETHAEQIIVGE